MLDSWRKTRREKFLFALVCVGSGTSADVAWSRASTWPMWAEVPEPTGASDQNSDWGVSMYLIELRFMQVYKSLR